MVSAVDVDSLDVNVPSSIEAGGDFDVAFTLRDPDETENNVNLDVEITVGDVLVHQDSMNVDLNESVDRTITVNSGSFSTDDGDVWDKNLMAYGCDSDIEVIVSISGDIDDVEDSDSIDIEADGDSEISSFDLSPTTLNLDDKFTVTVYDEDEDPLKEAWVKLTYVEKGDTDGEWDVSDKYTDDKTDSDGEATFKISSDISKAGNGKYQLDIWKIGYCKTTQLYSIQNILNISDPEPSAPKTGEPFKVRVTTPSGKSATGLLASLTPGGLKSSINMDGYATFTVATAGAYTISVGAGSSGYDETLKTVNVGAKSQLTVTVSPDPQSIGKPVILTVKSNGNEIDGATVRVTPPGGSEQTLSGTTSASGTIPYTGSAQGDYSVRASKSGYDDGTETFSVLNSFQITTPTTELKRGSEAAITVKDQSGAAVSGAAVSLEGTTISGTTDQSGWFSFTMGEAGTYDVLVKKTGFIDGTASLSSTGQLTVKLDKAEITLDESVKITVTDAGGTSVEAAIKVSGPSGSETYTDSEYSLTPTKAGTYAIEASKKSYSSSSETLTVKPRPLAITYQFKDDKLILNATTAGKPAGNVNINVIAGGITYSAATDSSGVASFAANATGNYTVQVASQDYDAKPMSLVKGSTAISDIWVPILIVLVLIVLIGIFAIVIVSLFYRRNGPKPAFKRSSGSRLGK
ncbi:MAG: carboxypeptidase-like regulatory domain-containing protein [Candidatus Altiarchaeota archaeon]